MMETELVIHCGGLESLTITVSGADHSIPSTAKELRVTTLLGSVDYTIDQLPVYYNLSDVHGSLIVNDFSGRPLYRWSRHEIVPSASQRIESQPTANTEKKKHTFSFSALLSRRTTETPLITGTHGVMNQPDSVHNALSGAGARAENSSGPRRVRSESAMSTNSNLPSLSRTLNKKTKSRHTAPSTVPRPNQQSKPRFPKKPSGLRGNISWPLELEMSLPSKQGHESLQALETTGGSDSQKSRNTPPKQVRFKKTGSVICEDSRGGELPSPIRRMSRHQSDCLREILELLLKEYNEDCRPFAEPIDAIAEGFPTYHTVIERPMDLRTLDENLRGRSYATIGDFELDFHLMIENSIRFNGVEHPITSAGLRLLGWFDGLLRSRFPQF